MYCVSNKKVDRAANKEIDKILNVAFTERNLHFLLEKHIDKLNNGIKQLSIEPNVSYLDTIGGTLKLVVNFSDQIDKLNNIIDQASIIQAIINKMLYRKYDLLRCGDLNLYIHRTIAFYCDILNENKQLIRSLDVSNNEVYIGKLLEMINLDKEITPNIFRYHFGEFNLEVFSLIYKSIERLLVSNKQLIYDTIGTNDSKSTGLIKSFMSDIANFDATKTMGVENAIQSYSLYIVSPSDLYEHFLTEGTYFYTIKDTALKNERIVSNRISYPNAMIVLKQMREIKIKARQAISFASSGKHILNIGPTKNMYSKFTPNIFLDKYIPFKNFYNNIMCVKRLYSSFTLRHITISYNSTDNASALINAMNKLESRGSYLNI